ncbi:hypothetical protein TNCV_112211 [Trichonephila clavipes]|nr:hypothetical protein TNCV_112211 [Trichonephila clavipes]
MRCFVFSTCPSPPYRDTPDITDFLGLHIFFYFLSRRLRNPLAKLSQLETVRCCKGVRSLKKQEMNQKSQHGAPLKVPAGFHECIFVFIQYLHPPWAQQGEAARRSSDMRQARHLPPEVVLETRIGTAELITNRLTGAGSPPSVYGEAWAKGTKLGTTDSTFPGTKIATYTRLRGKHAESDSKDQS